VPNIFAAGDLSTGRATVISAVAGGRRAARSIHFSLTRGDIPISSLVQHRINPESILKDIKVEQPTLRIEARELPVEVRRHSFTEEVVATISPEDAIAEAERCLHCGTLCYDKR
jgi:formate dehydrogenase (NADP+) beta subunit